MRFILNQEGFSLIVAVAVLLIFAVISALLVSLISNDSDMALYQFRSGEATYIANGGMQYAMMNYYPFYPNFSAPPFSTRGGTPQVNLGSGGFTVDPPGVLSSAITSAAATIPAVCFNRGVSVGCNTLFPALGRILVQSELINYTGVTATSFTGATRGVDGSLATSHAVDQGIYPASGLTVGVTSAATTIPVGSTVGFTIPGTVKIDQEYLYCTGMTATSFTGCTRGVQGSRAVAHTALATVIQVTVTVNATVPTGITGNARRVIKGEASIYLDAWVVGNNAGAGTPPAIVRWNGINWDNVATSATQNLNSVFSLDVNSDGAADDGWAVGNILATGPATSRWMFLRWNSPTAGAWNSVTVTTGINAQNLNSVYMVSSTDGWVVGNRRGCINPGPTILRWNGASWACPSAGVLPAAADQNLNSLYMVSSIDGWAVGNRSGAANTGWVLLRWNSPTAGAWNLVTVTTGINAQHLNSVYMVSSTDGWAMGNRRGCSSPGLTILRWNGTNWGCSGGLPGGVDENLNSVYCNSSTDCWAVGDAGAGASQRPLILHWDGATWGTQNSNLNVNWNLQSVYCNSTTDCWATGNAGSIFHWDGTNWSQSPSPTGNRINSVFRVRPQNFLRIGDWQEVY